MNQNVIEIHSDSEYQQLYALCLQNNNILVCDYSASWCRPCQQIAPFYQQLADLSKTDEETSNLFVFAKIDVDECPTTAAHYKVKAMPTFMVLYGGQQLQSMKGANKDGLRAMVEQAHLDWRAAQKTVAVQPQENNQEGQMIETA